jgi:hypothetical protein
MMKAIKIMTCGMLATLLVSNNILYGVCRDSWAWYTGTTPPSTCGTFVLWDCEKNNCHYYTISGPCKVCYSLEGEQYPYTGLTLVSQTPTGAICYDNFGKCVYDATSCDDCNYTPTITTVIPNVCNDCTFTTVGC